MICAFTTQTFCGRARARLVALCAIVGTVAGVELLPNAASGMAEAAEREIAEAGGGQGKLPIAQAGTLPAAQDAAGELHDQQKFAGALKQRVSLARTKPLSVQIAVGAICKKVGVPFQAKRSLKAARPECLRAIPSLVLREAVAEKAIQRILAPLGLTFRVDDSGLCVERTRTAQALRQTITLDLANGSADGEVTVEDAVKAICRAVDVPYQSSKSGKATVAERSRVIGPVHIRKAVAGEELFRLISPAGLTIDQDDESIWLVKATGVAALRKLISIDFTGKPGASSLTVGDAVEAICKEAGIAFLRESSRRYAAPLARTRIDPMHIRNVPAGQAISTIAAPAGLRFNMDSRGLWLYKLPDAALLKKRVTVEVSGTPGLSVQRAVASICEEAGIPYLYDESVQKAGSVVRRYTNPVRVRNKPAGEAIADVLAPLGLKFTVGPKGLYLHWQDGR